MKRDDVRSIVEGITDEQLDAIMQLNGAAVTAEKNKAKELQRKLDEATDRLKAADDEKDANAKATMTLEERIKAMEESYAAKEKTLAIEKNKLDAEKIFTAAGLLEDDYSPLMATVVSDNAEATVANANAIAALVSAQRANAEQSAKQSLMNGTPKPAGNAAKPEITKEQFMGMSYMERLALLNESPDTYKALEN